MTTLSLFHFVFPTDLAGALSRRDIGILRITENGKTGYGEVSPLPGFNQETFSEISDLKNLDAPSVSWGIESAKWNMEESEESRVLLCGLVLESDSIEKAVDFERAGFDFIKLKVGRDFKNDLKRIDSILKATKKLKLRLDFNGQGDVEDFELFSKNVSPNRVDYFEDPPAKEIWDFKVAVDDEVELFRDHENFVKIVKPTKIGTNLPKYFAEKKSPFVLSSSFESNLGLFSLGIAAQKWGLKEVVHGLDTSKYFRENIFDLQKINGSLVLPSNKWVRARMEEALVHQKPLAERSL